MERRPPEYHLEVCADRTSIRDVVKGILHTIFFHRYFTPLIPSTHEILDTTLPFISEDDIDTLIETRTNQLLRALDAAPSTRTPSLLQINFLERKRRKSGWFVTKADEETVWETWYISVELMTARSEPEAQRNRRLMERQLQKAAMKVIGIVNRERAHIPPITTNESNPFPYQIVVNPSGKEGTVAGISGKMGIF
ncbi:hypothetical protein PRZ48_007467 [Zasmidium cellare]|uniref:Autophagy-related protein 101 n=1 Tax=Zasmidium cellare TaxID=395010 RepID=A0ABR0EKJ4_ZASCE|nr:hypothetical protein PRZ48_007467 [Zasmidium cellare]